MIPVVIDHLGKHLRDLLDESSHWMVPKSLDCASSAKREDRLTPRRATAHWSGKMMERIIASRIVHHLTQQGPDVAECQYGFRAGRGTLDAIKALWNFSNIIINIT